MRWIAIFLFVWYTSALLGQSITARNTTYLPVVIHILYTNDSQNISNEQILKQIEALNKDFSQTNDNFDSTPEVFKNIASEIGFQFCLTSTDENGNETSGITRTETTVNEIGLTELYYETDNGGKDPWDVDRYINVWVADFGNTEILGVTPFPGEAVPKNKDGILVNYKYFGVGGDHQDMNRNLGKVLTHEMGHYFGLEHIWGSLGTLCNEDDNIDDTPLQNEPSFGCPDFPSPDVCTQGNGIMYSNFMDYTDDECLSMFTEGQKDVMTSTLDDFRAGLKDSGSMNCVLGLSKENTVEFEIYPNPARIEVWINFETEELNRKVQIYDIRGKLAKEGDVSLRENVIRIEDLTAGVYIFKVGNESRKVIVH